MNVQLSLVLPRYLQSRMQRCGLVVVATVSIQILPNENFEKHVIYEK
jgi:hypothetical protein